MPNHHIALIVGGVVVGAFIGYEWADTFAGYPVYSSILDYMRG